MSLQKIGKYTEIFEASRKLQRPTMMDSKRSLLIQNIAIAGLIDSGAPYEINNGEIIIDTGTDYKSVLMNDIYQYLSPEGQTSLIIKNAQKAELPPPVQRYTPQQIEQLSQLNMQTYSQDNYNYQNNYSYAEPQQVQQQTQSVPEYQTEYQTAASKEAEKKQDPVKAIMDGLEDYSYDTEQSGNLSSVPEDDELEAIFQNNLKQKTIENQRWENMSYAGNSYTEEPQPETPVPQQLTPVQLSYESDTDVLYSNQTAQPVEIDRTEGSDDVLEMLKENITYERCNIEVKNITSGVVYRFAVHAAPLTGLYDNNIIVRIKLLGKESNYIVTNCGTTVDFAVEQALIRVTREQRTDGIFSCQFAVSNGYEINKLNIEHGGHGGNLVIYDQNLELRIYPLPNIKDKETGKMVFGNNKKGEAAYLYFIKIGEHTIASSGVERIPTFTYNGCELIIRAKWSGNTVLLSADEYTGENNYEQ